MELTMNYGANGCARTTTLKRWSTALTSVLMFLLLLTVNGCSSQQRPHATPPLMRPLVDHSITFTFNQSTVNNGFCSATITTSCISGFNEGYLSGSTQVQLHSDLPAICTGTAQPLTCTSTFNGILPIGGITFYVATTFVDQNGAAGVTAAALSPVVPVKADPAANVQVTVQ